MTIGGLLWSVAFCLLLFAPPSSLFSLDRRPNFSPINTAVLEQPYSAQVGDFNEDGHLDIASSNQYRNQSYITIMLGNGRGEFPLKTIVPLSGNFVRDILLTDVNADGHADICAVCMLSSTVSIVLGDGQGHFEDEVVYETGLFPEYISGGDFDGNDHPDLVLSHWSTGDISVMMNDGEGGFLPGCDYDVGGGTKEIDVGDFNEDDNLDIAVATMAFNEVIILFGDGDGDFPVQRAIDVDHDAYVVRTAFFNQDEHLDLAVGTKHSFMVLLGNGTGRFSRSNNVQIFDPHAIQVADFNEDGFNDAAVSMTQSDLFEVFLGDGEGGFDHVSVRLDLPDAPRSLDIGDFNEDAHQDLVSANEGSNDLTLLINQVDLLLIETVKTRMLYTAGEMAEFTFTVGNPQDTTVQTTLWFTLERGSDQEVVDPELLEGMQNPQECTFLPGQESEYTVTYQIPLDIELGLYQLYVNAGDYGRIMDGLWPSNTGDGYYFPVLWNSIVWSSGKFPIRIIEHTADGHTELHESTDSVIPPEDSAH